MSKNIVIIGGGPAGYAAAIKAAQLGAKVTLVESVKVGGTCLNVGCIPTKSLLHTGEFYRKAAANSVAGVNITGLSLDWQAAQQHKNSIVEQLTSGVKALLKHNGVTVCAEVASLLPGLKVKAGSEIIQADAIVLATGSVSSVLSFPGSDLPGVIDSTSALSLESVPKSLVIVGGGVISIEFVTLFNALGTKVTILEMLPEILPQLDPEIAGLEHAMLDVAGVQVFTSARLNRVTQTGDALTVSFELDGKEQQVAAEKVLVAVGRKPQTAGLGLENIDVETNRGAIVVDDNFQTNITGLYAVGDCNGQMMLAHAAMAQGISAVEHIMGKTSNYNSRVIPSCVYCSPEIASVGMTEKQVQDAGIPYTVGRFSLGGNGKSIIEDAGEGLIKIIADKKLGEILGVHMIGPRVTEMIAEAALCMNMEGTVEDIVNTIHAHPTVSEAVCEAAMSAFGNPIHGV